MKVLVTGAAGFIGSNFIRWQLETYPELAVINVDKLTYAGNLESLAGARDSNRHTHFKVDIGDRAAVEQLEPALAVRAHAVGEGKAAGHEGTCADQQRISQ